MIRMVLAVFLTVAALVGLSLRMARDAGTAPPLDSAAAQVRTLDLGDAVASARGGARRVAKRAADAVSDAALEALAAEAALRIAPPEPPPAESVEPPPEEEILPARRTPFAEAPLPDAGDSGAPAPEEGAPDPAGPTWVAASVDQDAWADLIRRMLSVYRRTGAGE